MIDISPHIKTKSNQLNADDLLSGDITVRVTNVRAPGGEQPVVISISGGHMDFKPSKTVRRVLVHAWGSDGEKWIGRWMRLHRDEKVKWAGEAVGGIRVVGLSDIAGPITLSLNESKKTKKTEQVAVLRPTDCREAGAPTAKLDDLLSDIGLTTEDVDRWLADTGRPSVANLSPANRSKLAAALAADAAKVDAIRKLRPSDAPDEVAFDDLPDGRTYGEE